MDFLKKPGLIVAILAIVGLGSYLIREFFPKKITETIIRDSLVVIPETVYVEKIIFKQLPAKIESVFVAETTWVASIDTILYPFGDSLSIWYYFPPVNAFDFSFKPNPRPVQFEYRYRDTTVYVTIQESDFWGDLLSHSASVLVGFGLKSVIK